MKSLLPLAIISLALLPSCEKHEEAPASQPSSTKPATLPATQPALTTTAPSTGPFESIAEIWRLVPAADKPPDGSRFSAEQRNKSNLVFAESAIGKTIRITLPEITVDRAPGGNFKGFVRIRSNPPSSTAKVHFCAYFDTADEATSKQLMELRNKSSLTVEGIITRCDITMGPNFNVDIRQSKVIPAKPDPALPAAPTTKPK